MGDGVVIWWLVLSLNGLPMSSIEPFNSEEGCKLAGRAAQFDAFDCVDVAIPYGAYGERSST